MSIIFYDCQTAPSPRRARIILAEKNITHEVVQVDMRNSEQLSPAFRKINPNCTVPALVTEDGATLFESWGIALWAEAVQPQPALLGKTTAERGLVGSWASKTDFHGTISFAEAFRNLSKGLKDRALPGPRNFQQMPELAERGMIRLKDFFDDLERRLEGREFIATDEFTIADIWALTVIDACAWIKVSPSAELPNLQAWHKRVLSRPSAQL